MRLIFSILLVILSLANSWAEGPDVIVEPTIAWQGKVITVNVSSEGDIASVKGRFLDQDFRLYKKGDVFRGIVGVPINQKAGYYTLKLFFRRLNGTTMSGMKRLKVWDTKFPFSRYWLKPHKKKLMKPELVNRDWAQIERVLVKERPQQLWAGKFVKPVDNIVSQGFGHRQIVNGRRSGNHRGVDFGSPIGTQVKAPNKGKVVFRKYLDVFGGTLVIDHGQGIHTLYYHLMKCFPEVGQMVEKGEVIALTGHSGVSSGPHLHWGMSVHNLRVDPLQWVKHEL
jgi:murein DD-endopeptidase MepM/ murein hydrolase activator NlpD